MVRPSAEEFFQAESGSWPWGRRRVLDCYDQANEGPAQEETGEEDKMNLINKLFPLCKQYNQP